VAIIYIPLEGVLHGRKPAAPKGYYWRPWKGLLILAKSPHTGKFKRSDLQNAWVANFKEIACYTKWVDPKTFDSATELAKGTNWYYRDVIERALSAKLISRAGETRITTPTCRMHRAVAENLTSGVFKTLTPDVEDWDNNNFHNPSSNPTRMTFRSAGLYLVGWEIDYNAGSGLNVHGDLMLNGTTIIATSVEVGPSSYPPISGGMTLYYFHANDYIECRTVVNAASKTALLAALWCVAITPETII